MPQRAQSSPRSLLETARGRLALARELGAVPRFTAAYLAALGAATAAVCARLDPAVVRNRPRPLSVWAQLASVAPELRNWAAYYTKGARVREALAAGIAVVTEADADELLARTTEFVDLVDQLLPSEP